MNVAPGLRLSQQPRYRPPGHLGRTPPPRSDFRWALFTVLVGPLTSGPLACRYLRRNSAATTLTHIRSVSCRNPAHRANSSFATFLRPSPPVAARQNSHLQHTNPTTGGFADCISRRKVPARRERTKAHPAGFGHPVNFNKLCSTSVSRDSTVENGVRISPFPIRRLWLDLLSLLVRLFLPATSPQLPQENHGRYNS